MENNDFSGLIPPSVATLCDSDSTRCTFSGNKRLCGDGERVMTSTCSPCPSKGNCAANGECHNGFDPSDYFCATCAGESFDAGGTCVACVGGEFGVILPIAACLVIIIICYTIFTTLKQRGLFSERFIKFFNPNIAKQTILKQLSTILQVLSVVSSQIKSSLHPFNPTSIHLTRYARCSSRNSTTSSSLSGLSASLSLAIFS